MKMKNLAYSIFIITVLLATGCKDKTLPVVTTKPVTDITETTATSGGTVTSDGNAEITQKGICWNTSENPTVSNSTITHGPGASEFTSNIVYLITNTKYHVRAFATNSVGTTYGEDVSFTTRGKPQMGTVAATTISSTGAVCGGNVIKDGGSAVTERGICYSLTDFPTIFSSIVTNGTGAGSYSVTLTGLTPNTVYYFRAYAINSTGVGYGNILSFTTSPEN
jgi:hypothetical protein